MSASPALKSWQAAFATQTNASAQQRAAFADFLAIGLPTTKLDMWKYTDLRRFAMKQFRVATSNNAELPATLLPFENCIAFVDGALKPSPPSWGRAGERVFASLKIQAPSPPPSLTMVEETRTRPDAFDLLNGAFASDVQIAIADDTVIDQPIYLAFAWTQAAFELMSHPRINLRLGRNSKATLIEHHTGANTQANFTNSVVHIDLGANAELEHIRVQDDAQSNFNIGSVHATVAKGARYLSHQYIIGGGLARADIRVELAGAEAHTELHGLVFAQDAQHLDVRTVIHHQAPNTTSAEDYRGIADQRGRVVFNGKVIVAKDAQRTDARQSSRNLLLSKHAEIDTRPELEIYANDVKCAHGATVGQLDATALFYLQSRGIARAEARALLTHAFAAELIERIPVPAVREHVLSRLMQRMRHEGVEA